MRSKEDILEDYLAFRSLKNKTKGGIQDIRFHIERFLNHSDKPLDEFDELMLTNYVAEINNKYKINMSNTVKSSYLKNFIKWYFEDWSSRFRNIQTICATQKADVTYSDKDMLSEEDVNKLIKEEESNFWKAYFLTLFYGGCRPIEVVNLKWDDLEWDEDGVYFTIHSKKNKKEFVKFVPSDVSFYLNKLKGNNSKFVFCNPRTKKPISVKGAYWKIRQMSEKVLGKKINLYILRHSIATINYAKIGDKHNELEEVDVANSMGHSKSMRSTYEHKNREKLKENAKKIYIKPDELPPEKRQELEKQIHQLKEAIEIKDKSINDLIEKKFEEELSKYTSQLTPDHFRKIKESQKK